MRLRLGERHAILAVVLAEALVTYGGVSLFRILGAPMAQALFRVALPRRLMPAAIAPGNLHPHDVGLAAHADRCAARNIPWFVQEGDQRP